ncbi:MAG: dTDP-4-dehydrorhamnose 3,5-epimerase [Gammaproteobacteria bacterium]|nr:dTDP-4-dehydrorhamnose 3,5-epimerase [Gammaproteobacteria bacterium]
MKILKTSISDLIVILPDVHADDRGFFLESFRSLWLPDHQFVQDNHSHSIMGTLRGLHYQMKNPQGKLVRVIRGKIFDVAVDLRARSPTFGNWESRLLSEDNKEIFWIPPGFAHGFLVISKSADVIYRCTNYYDPKDEHTIIWNDPEIGIDWPLEESRPVLSERDLNGILFSDAPSFP